MRVTTLGSTNNSTRLMQAAAERLADRQEQVATGLRLVAASDSPSDAATVLRSQRSLDRLEQLEGNTTDAKMWLETGDTAVNSAITTLTRARNLAVNGANSVNTPEARRAIAADIRSISDELLSLANSKLNGRSVFAGTSGADIAFDANGIYQGDDGQTLRSVTTTDSFVVAVPGPQVFGEIDGLDPLNGTVFQMLNTVADSVEAGDFNAVRDGIEAIDSASERVQTEATRLGGLAARLDEITSRNEALQISTRSQISEVRDVDMGDAILRLRTAETTYEAAISAAGRSLGRSLLDFLR